MQGEKPNDIQMKSEGKHSGFVVTGFILALISAIGALGCYILPILMRISNQQIGKGTALLFGLSFFTIFIISVLGVIVNTISVFQHKQRRAFSLFGLLISLLVSIVIGSLIIPQVVLSFD